MTDCIILYRTNDGQLCVVRDANDVNEIAIFPHWDAAIAHCESTGLFGSDKVPYQIVELDEL